MSILKEILERRALTEGNAENKVKKNLHATKLGYKTSLTAMLPDKQTNTNISKNTYMKLAADQSGHSLDHQYKKTADDFKKAGRSSLKNPLKEEEHLDEAMRLIGTHKSENGKHEAKVYKDSEWGEHRVKFFINGKHHEPSDYYTDDKHDAHHTAQHQLGQLDKLHSALKEDVSPELLDELSKATLGRYVRKSASNLNTNSYDVGHHDGMIDAGHKNVDSNGKNTLRPTPAADKADRKASNRMNGIGKAVRRLQKENAKPLNSILEDAAIIKRGRPKKARHEDGEIVNDPKA